MLTTTTTFPFISLHTFFTYRAGWLLGVSAFYPLQDNLFKAFPTPPPLNQLFRHFLLRLQNSYTTVGFMQEGGFSWEFAHKVLLFSTLYTMVLPTQLYNTNTLLHLGTFNLFNSLS